MKSTTNIKTLRRGVVQLMDTVQENQSCKADVEKLAGQLSRVVSQVTNIQSNLKTLK